MKLLLTSAGFTNDSIKKALLDLTGRSLDQLNLAFIPTAADVGKGDKGWLIDDLSNCKNLGFASIDIVDISAIPKGIWEEKLKNADILLFGGGNTFHLMYWLNKSGLAEMLPEMLKEKIYVGISAGSIVASHKLSVSDSERLYCPEGYVPDKDEPGLGFVNFHIRPHLNSPYFPKLRKDILEELAKELSEPLYAIDNQTAIKVVDDKIEIISEGEYLELNT